MLYIINGEYYMLRNREYVSVDINLSGNEFSITPNRNKVIESSGNVKVKSVLMDDVIKELKNKQTPKEESGHKKKYNI